MASKEPIQLSLYKTNTLMMNMIVDLYVKEFGELKAMDLIKRIKEQKEEVSDDRDK